MEPDYTFLLNWLAILPIASIIFTCIEIVGEHAGPQRGGLIDAFIGKAVEQIMCVQCMRAGLVQVLQGNLMGSLHWNLLLVLGMSIFVSGVKQTSTAFKASGASAQMSCQIVGSISIALPTMFRNISDTITDDTILWISRIIAFVTMIVYMLFLLFHFVTHKEAFEDPSVLNNIKTEMLRSASNPSLENITTEMFRPNEPPRIEADDRERTASEEPIAPRLSPISEDEGEPAYSSVGRMWNSEMDADGVPRTWVSEEGSTSRENTLDPSRENTLDPCGKLSPRQNDSREAELEQHEYALTGDPILSCATAVMLLLLSIFTCGCSSQKLVSVIPQVSEQYGIPKAFIGVTLLPIIGNTAEHVAALTCAFKGEMDLVIDIAVGSATQIALFVIPGAVLWGWVFDMEFTMNFRSFDAMVMLLSTFLVSQVLQHGNTNWLHGAMLMITYTLIAIISWFIPE